MNNIIIIEGTDACGKTTLANQIMQKYPNHVYMHNAVTDDIYALHKNTMDAAIEASKYHTVIIDRLHLSEQIYGTVYRDGPSYDTSKFDKWINTIPNVKKIICIVDKETCLQKHSGRKDQEMFDDVSKVWDMYNEFNDPTWMKYNWKIDRFDLDQLDLCHRQILFNMVNGSFLNEASNTWINDKMRNKYSRKQIVEAINYWKNKLNESTEDDFFQARMDNEDLLDEIAAQIRSGEKINKQAVAAKLAASAARMAAAAAANAKSEWVPDTSSSKYHEYQAQQDARYAAEEAALASRRAARADSAGDPVDRFMRS